MLNATMETVRTSHVCDELRAIHPFLRSIIIIAMQVRYTLNTHLIFSLMDARDMYDSCARSCWSLEVGACVHVCVGF